jgi:hypothetical protein
MYLIKEYGIKKQDNLFKISSKKKYLPIRKGIFPPSEDDDHGPGSSF